MNPNISHQTIILIPPSGVGDLVWGTAHRINYCRESEEFVYMVETTDGALKITGHLSDIQRWIASLYNSIMASSEAPHGVSPENTTEEIQHDKQG